MSPSDQTRFNTKSILLLTVLAVLVFGNHLNNPFQFDSVEFIPENPMIQNPQKVLNFDYLAGQYFSRGTLFFTFGLNAKMGGMETLGFHLFNLGFHIINSVLIFFVTAKACRYFRLHEKLLTHEQVRLVSLFTSILFLCHPIQTESVVYIISRSEVLAATFYLTALLTFQTALDNERPVTSIFRKIYTPLIIGLCFVVGFSVKQTVITLPMTLLLYYLFGLSADSPPIQFLKKWKYVIGAVLLLALAGLFYKLFTDESFLIGPSVAGENVGRKNYMLSQPWVLIFYYVKLLFFPFNLNIDPDIFMVTRWYSWRFVLGAGLITLLFYLSAKARGSKIYLFCICWFFVVASPSSSIVTLLDLGAEHRVYLASYGFYLLFILGMLWLVQSLTRFSTGQKKIILYTMMGLIVISFSLLTVKRNAVWSSELELWHDVAKKSPHKTRPWINLGRAYTINGDLEKATRYYQKSLAINPNYFESNYNLAVVYLKKEQEDEALKYFKLAEKMKPYVPEVHAKLGELYLKNRKYHQAESHFKKAAELNPNMAPVFRNLGIINFYYLNRQKQGLAYFSRSLYLDPNQKEANIIRQLVANGASP